MWDVSRGSAPRRARWGVRRRLAAGVAAGVALGAAFPPVDLWFLAPVGVAVLVLAVRDQSWRVAASVVVVSQLVLFVPLLEWTRFLGVGPWLALALLQAVIMAPLGPLLAAAQRGHRTGVGRDAAVVLGVAGALVLVEAMRARVPFGGFTWGRLAFGQSEGPLLPLAALGGVPGLSAAVGLAGGLLAVLARAGRRQPAARGGAVAVGAVGLLGLVLAARAVPTPTAGPVVQVAAVQGNVSGQGLDALGEDLAVLRNHVEQTRALSRRVAAGAPRPQLVIWPENASDQDPRNRPEARALLDEALQLLDRRPFLTGAVLREGGQATNSLLVWGPDGVTGPVYDKRHLVPFGEYLPLPGLAQAVYPSARRLLPQDYTPGRRVGRVDLQGVPLAVGTCYEVAFDPLLREAVRGGGQLLVLPSNNASYGRSAQSAQQLAIARLRAVEHGRSAVVSTTSGISALIRPDGGVLMRSGLFEPAVLAAPLPLRTGLTLATRYGGPVELALSCLVAVPWLVRRLARTTSRPAAPGGR